MCSIKDNDLDLDPDEEYGERCGELFLTTKGKIIFHCTLCASKYNGFEKYSAHVTEKHTTPIRSNTDVFQNTVDNEFEETEFDFDNFDDNIVKDELEEMACSSDDIFNHDALEENEIVIEEEVPVDESSLTNDRKEEPTTQAQKEVKKASSKNLKKIDYTSIIEGDKNTIRPTLKRYTKAPPPTEVREHSCPICQATFKTKSNLNHHLRRHSKERPHQCPQCERKFYTTKELNFHIETHTQERQFLCSECGQLFRKRFDLDNHMRRHNNQRDFKCTECDKSYFSKSSLQEHMVRHSTERPFKCEICSATLLRAETLAKHMKLHNNKREYKCQLCDASFNQSAGLYNHMRSTHKVGGKSTATWEGQTDVFQMK